MDVLAGGWDFVCVVCLLFALPSSYPNSTRCLSSQIVCLNGSPLTQVARGEPQVACRRPGRTTSEAAGLLFTLSHTLGNSWANKRGFAFFFLSLGVGTQPCRLILAEFDFCLINIYLLQLPVIPLPTQASNRASTEIDFKKAFFETQRDRFL